MSDDGDLRRELQRALGATTDPGISLTAVARAGARRRRARRALIAGAAALAVAPVAWWARIELDSPNRSGVAAPPPATTEPSPAWTTYRDEDDGFSVSYPGSWNRATEVLTPNLEDPREILVIGTVPLAAGSGECAHFPEDTIEAMGPGDVLVSLQESAGRLEGSYVIERPAQFALSQGYESEVVDCLPETQAGYSSRLIPFRDGGRSFYALIVLGPAVSDEDTRTALRILDSLVVDAR